MINVATTSFSKKEKEAAERRNKSRKNKYKKARIVVAIVACLAICAVVVCVLSLTVLFKVEAVNVFGSTTYTAEEVISAAGVVLGDNLIRVSEDEISQNLQKKLPFINEVVIEKQL